VKKSFRILSLLLLSGITLYSCNQPASSDSSTTTDTESSVSISDLNIAYVSTDSVINKYEYFKLKSDEITEKGKRFETELQSRAQGFEREVANFQQSANNMTQNQALAKQDELVKKEQNLMTYRNNIMQELSADEANLYNEVYEEIQTFMETFAKENGYSMILSKTRGGAVWYANESIDVTEAVIEGLNKAYNENNTDSVK